MPDMLVRLYDLPDSSPYDRRIAEAGITVRRMEAWDRVALRSFIAQHFTEGWATEADFAFNGGHPVTGFVAVKDGRTAGFAVYECSRRNYFGPTGVREDLRGSGAGAVLLFRCLESMREMGYGYAIIGWVGPAAFYSRICGATVIEGSSPGVYADMQSEAAARRADTAPESN
ncbi:MAG: GNAT family N-acetyltransferase [Chloroflexi bacterium]|nr:GNAT family N-acetyltransferase [Chloroflexota bacterium]